MNAPLAARKGGGAKAKPVTLIASLVLLGVAGTAHAAISKNGDVWTSSNAETITGEKHTFETAADKILVTNNLKIINSNLTIRNNAALFAGNYWWNIRQSPVDTVFSLTLLEGSYTAAERNGNNSALPSNNPSIDPQNIETAAFIDGNRYTARSTIGASGDILVKNGASVTLTAGSLLMSQFGKIDFRAENESEQNGTLIIDTSLNDENENQAVLGYKGIYAVNQSNKVYVGQGRSIAIKSYSGNIHWEGSSFDAANVDIQTAIQKGEDVQYDPTETRTGDITVVSDGIIRLDGGAVTTNTSSRSNTNSDSGSITLNAKGGDLSLLGVAVHDSVQVNLQTAKSIRLDTSTANTATEIGAHPNGGRGRVDVLNLTAQNVYANHGSGGHAQSINVRGNLYLDNIEGSAGSHLIANGALSVLHTDGTVAGGNVVQMGSSSELGGGTVSITADQVTSAGGKITGTSKSSDQEASVVITVGSTNSEAKDALKLSNGASIVGTHGVMINVAEDAENKDILIDGADSSINGGEAGSTVNASGGNIVMDNGGFVTSSAGMNTLTANSVSLDNGSHIGTDGQTTGDVKINSPSLSLDHGSYVTSSASIAVENSAGNVTVTMDNGQEPDSGYQPSWIKGHEVNIGTTDQSGKTTVTGGSITATDKVDGTTTEGGSVTIAGGAGEVGGITINDSSISASANGTVNIAAGAGSTLNVGTEEDGDPLNDLDTKITGGTINIGLNNGTNADNTIVINDAQIGEGSFKSDINISAGTNKNVSIDNSSVNAGVGGSVDIVAGGKGNVIVGNSEAKEDTALNKDTQIIGDNITIGSQVKGDSNNITITDAVIGRPDGSTVGGSSISINGGAEGSVGITGSTVGVGTGNNPAASAEVTISGNDVTIGDIPRDDEEGLAGDGYDTTIGGNNIVIGDTGTGKVTIGDAQIVTGVDSSITINAGDAGNPGTINIGSVEGRFDSSINGGTVNIGTDSDSNADININGSRDDNNPEDSTTSIAGSNVNIGNGSNDVAITDSNITSTDNTTIVGNADPKEDSTSAITGSNITSDGDVNLGGNLNISAGSDIVAGNGDNSGSVNFGPVEGSTISSGSITIDGGSEVGGDGVNIGSDTTVTVGDGADSTGSITAGSDGISVSAPEGESASGSLIVNEGGSVTTTDNGKLDIGGSVDVNGGGNVDAEGIITVGDNGGLTVDGSDSDNKGSVNGSSITSNGGTIAVGDNGSITSDTDITFGGDSDIDVSAGGSITAGGSVTVEGTADVDVVSGQITVGSDESGGNFVVNGGTVDVTDDGSININGNGQSGDTGNGDMTVTGGQVNVGEGSITAEGDMNVNDGGVVNVGTDPEKPGSIEVGGDANFNAGSDVTIGEAGSIAAEGNVSVQGGQESTEPGSVTIVGGELIAGGKDDPANGGNVTIGGNVNIKNDGTIVANGDGETTGNVTIGNGSNVNIGETGQDGQTGGGSIVADGDVTIEGVGGDETNNANVTIGNGGSITAGNDVVVNGDIDLVGNGDGKAPVIDAGNQVVVGDNEAPGSGSINVNAGNTGVIIAGGKDTVVGESNVVIGNGGSINVGSADDGKSEGGLFVTDSEQKVPDTIDPGLKLDTGTSITVENGGHLTADTITGDAGSIRREEGSYVSTSKDTVLNNGDLSNSVIQGDSSGTVDFGDEMLTAGELSQIRDHLGDDSNIVIERVDGMPEDAVITKADLETNFSNAVIGDAVIDVTNKGTDSDNTLTQGGGGSIQVGEDGDLIVQKDPNSDHKNNGHVTITGSSDKDSYKDHESVDDGNPETDHDIILKDETHLTFGDNDAQGGHLSGNISADESNTKGVTMDVVGGDFTVDGDINLGTNGDLILNDIQDGNVGAGNASLTVGGSVNTGSLNMTGEDTNLDVANSLTAGDTTLSGDADISSGQDANFGDLVLNDSASVTDKNGDGEHGHADFEADNVTMNDNSSINRGNVVIGTDGQNNGNLTMNGSSSLNASDTTPTDENPALDVAGNVSINTGDDDTGSATINVSGDADIEGSWTQGNGTVTIDGKLDIAGDINQSGGTIKTDGIAVGKGDSNEGHTIGGKVEVGQGGASFGDSLTIAEGGSLINNGELDGTTDTTISGDLTIIGDGDRNTTDDQLGDAEINGSLNINNGTVESGKLGIDGNLELNGESDLSSVGGITIGGDGTGDHNLTVNGGSSIVVADNAKLEGEDGNITVAGDADISEGSVEASGNITISGNGGLAVGSNSDQTKGDASIESDSLDVSGGPTHIYGNGEVVVNGDGAEKDPSANFSSGVTVEKGGSFTNNGKLDGVADTVISSGGLTITGDGDDSTLDSDLADAEITGNVTLSGAQTEGGKLIITDGNFTLGKDAETENGSGSTHTATGNVDVENGDLTINDGSSLNAVDNPETEVSEGHILVKGNAEINNGSLTAEGNLMIQGNEGLKVGSEDGNAHVEIGDDLTVEGGHVDVAAGSTVIAQGGLKISGNETGSGDGHKSGSLHLEGSITADHAKIGTDLELGSGTFEEDPENPDRHNGSLITSGETGVTVGGSATLNDKSFVYAEGDIKFGTSESVTDKTFSLGEGANVTSNKGTVSFGSEGAADSITVVGPLEGFIDAPHGIDLSGLAPADGISFSGTSAGVATGSFKGDVTFENGANAVISNESGDASKTATIDGWLHAAAGDGQTSFGSTITTNRDHMNDYSGVTPSGDNQNATFYMDQALSFANGTSGIAIGRFGDYSYKNNGGAHFGDNASWVLNGANIASGTDLFGGSTVFVDGGPVDLTVSGMKGEASSLVFTIDPSVTEDSFNITSGSWLADYNLAISGNKAQISMKVKDVEDATGGTVSGDKADAIENVLKKNGPGYVAAALDQLFNTSADSKWGAADGDKFLLNAAGSQAVSEILTFPIVAGGFNATYDYLTEFNRAVDSRAMEPRIDGAGHVWAHVIATFNKSDKIFGGSGYSADLYGGVLGADAVLANGTMIGGALTVGNGDVESRGAVIDTKNDATFYGLSAYVEHNFGGLSVKGDVTYLRTENDIAANFEGVNMGGSMDSDAISVGVRTEFAAYSGEKFEVRPHFGLRYTNYSFDNYRGTDIDDINVIEAPIGVAFTGKIDAAGGWKVAPELDLSVVPQLGDREATVVNAGAGVDQDVLEGGVFNAKIGLGVQKDNFTFGMNYQRGEGGQGRSNNAFQAYARWTF